MLKTINQAIIIAKITLIVHIRQKLPYILVIFGVLALFVLQGISSFDIKMQVKLFSDLSLAMITIMGMAITLMVSYEEMIKEKEKGTLQLILAGPVKRSAFLGGKLFGVASANLMAILIMGVASYISAIIGGFNLASSYILALFFIWLRLLILAALTLFFSLFLSRALTVVMGTLIFAYGHGQGFVSFAASQGGGGPLLYLVKGLNWLIPDLDLLSLGNAVVHGGVAPVSYIVGAAFYALAMVAGIYLLALFVFRRQDL